MTDFVLAAIVEHRAAWDAFQVAPEGEPSEQANDRLWEAMGTLLATPCASRPGAWAVLDHLRWWLGEEAEFADAYQPTYGLAEARAKELAMLLDGAAAPAATPDPIHAAVRAAIEADEALTAICEALDESNEPAMRRHNVASDRAGMARKALAGIVPTSLDGTRTLARYYARYEEHPEGFEHLVRALEVCESTRPFSASASSFRQTGQRLARLNREGLSSACERVSA